MKPLIFLYQECYSSLEDTLNHRQILDPKNGLTIVEYDGITVPIANPLCYRESLQSGIKERNKYFTSPLMSLKRQIRRDKTFILKLSHHFDCDSMDEHIRRRSEQALLQELQHSIISEPDFLYLTLKSSHNVNLARIINENLKGK